MSALYAFVNFALAFLFVIAQILCNDNIRITYRQVLKDVVLGEFRPLLQQISDISRFLFMAIVTTRHSLADFQAMFYRMDKHLRLNFQSFRSGGMPTLLGFENFMGSPACCA